MSFLKKKKKKCGLYLIIVHFGCKTSETNSINST